jgi:hypothetical protein
MNGDSSQPPDSYAGQKTYTPLLLAFYDLGVIGLSNSYIWKCPSSRLLEHYNQHVSGAHLDIGVGTGYFLDKCRFPTAQPPHPSRTVRTTAPD